MKSVNNCTQVRLVVIVGGTEMCQAQFNTNVFPMQIHIPIHSHSYPSADLADCISGRILALDLNIVHEARLTEGSSICTELVGEEGAPSLPFCLMCFERNTIWQENAAQLNVCP